MNVSLRQLRVFLAVARHGSFSHAAEEVGTSQSAVSLAVQQLEAELGVKLLDRTTRQVHITGIGQILVANGSRLIAELDTTLKELKDIGAQHRGHVSMACVPSIACGLMPACIEYCARKWPNVSFAIEDVAATDVVNKVLRGDVEFGLASGTVDASELHFENLMQDPFVLICRRDDLLAQRRTIPWTRLGETRLIMLNNTSGSHRQIVETLAQIGARPKIFLELAQPSSVLAMVEAGLGVAVVPQMVASHPNLTGLVTRKLVGPQVSRTILLLRRRDRSLSPAATAVWMALREICGARRS